MMDRVLSPKDPSFDFDENVVSPSAFAQDEKNLSETWFDILFGWLFEWLFPEDDRAGTR